MEQLATILARWVWGVPAMVLMLAVGLLLTMKTRFIQVRKLGASLKLVGRSLCRPAGEGVSPFQAVCTALAATVGTGNIAGVAGALALGGPGAVFWMWVSAFLGMATKYAEVALSLRYRTKDARGQWVGGAMYTIRQNFSPSWQWLGVAFAGFAMLASLGMGNMAQVNTISTVVLTAVKQYAPELRPEPVTLFVGAVSAVLVAMVTFGGAKRVGQVMERLVPFVAVIYILGSLWVIFGHMERIPQAFADIIRGAFDPRALLGGGAGIGIGQAMRWGVSRGVFSNEAGLGSAPLVHASAEALPEEQGLMGIFEVFLDTLVLCTLTALTILVSGIPIPYGHSAGAELVSFALETVMGSWSAGVLAVCVTLLALATLMTWQLYGLQCAGFLWGEPGEHLYRLVYVAVIVLGATMEMSAVWAWADVCNGLMALPNLATLLVLRNKIPVRNSPLPSEPPDRN